MAFTAHAKPSSESFFRVLEMSPRNEARLALDQGYFMELPESVYRSVFAYYLGWQYSTRQGVREFFSSHIDFFIESPVRSCPDSDGRTCPVASVSLLDNNLLLYIPWLEERDSVYVGDTQLRVTETKPSMLLRKSGQIESHLGLEAQSIYRLTHYLSLAYLTKLLYDDSPPLASCRNIMGAHYRCDALDKGVMSFAGALLQSLKQACRTCSLADRTTLDMVSTHYLLRSDHQGARQRGIALFSRHREAFREVGISYEQLNEIYREALSRD